MNGIAQLWSQPWHDLQRSLAAGFGGSAAGAAGDLAGRFLVGAGTDRAGTLDPPAAK